MKKFTDTQRLDLLQKCLGYYTGHVICRWSSNGRGWRLHETEMEGSCTDVREAIDKFLSQPIPLAIDVGLIKPRNPRNGVACKCQKK